MSAYAYGVRLLFSADLAGATAFKTAIVKAPANALRETGDPFGTWLSIFHRFYTECLGVTREKFAAEIARAGIDDPVQINLWKLSGDEVLLYSTRISDARTIPCLARAFHAMVEELDGWFLHEYGLGVKGVIWAAAFPERNRELLINPDAQPHVRPLRSFWHGKAVVEDGAERKPVEVDMRSGRYSVDFIGPEIDLGFRLGSAVSARRVAVSTDVANFLAATPDGSGVRLFHVGWRELKGIYGGLPYPIVWIDFGGDGPPPRRRTSYEQAVSDLAGRFLSRDALIEHAAMMALYEEQMSDASTYRQAMTLEGP